VKKKLTEEQIEARMEAFEQAARALEVGDWSDDEIERKQGVIACEQIRKFADRWYRKINST
jgi:galactokinase